MVEVEKYIRKLLYEQDCVIVPEFGGLLTHYTAARFQAESGHYLPSGKKVAFNEVLKMDDGLLAQYISVNEGISRENAQQCIRDFVATALTLIRKNKLITLNGIGSFRMNEENRLLFEPEPQRNFHTEFYGFDKIPARELATAKKTAFSDSYEIDPDASEEPLFVPQQRKSSNWLSWASAAVIAGLVVYVSAVLSEKPRVMDTSSLNPFTVIAALWKTEPGVEKAGVLSNTTKEIGTAAKVPATPVVEKTVTEETASGENENAPAAEEPAAVSVPKKSTRFFIITSVYESRSTLNKYGQEVQAMLKENGFENVSTLEVKDRYMIAAGGYPSWGAASRDLPKLRGSIAKGAWIYKAR